MKPWEGRTDKRTRSVLSSFGDKESTRSLPLLLLPVQNLIKTEQFPFGHDCTMALEGWTAMGSDGSSGGFASCCKTVQPSTNLNSRVFTFDRIYHREIDWASYVPRLTHDTDSSGT